MTSSPITKRTQEKYCPDTSNCWIFGYGSLIWKPPPHIAESQPGFIKHFVRRFWHESPDHRGTPQYPGRVVNLISREDYDQLADIHPCPEHDLTWGVAYRIIPDKVEEVLDALDIRENHGYNLQKVPVYGSLESNVPTIQSALVYIGTIDNEAFCGPPHSIDADEIAQRIYDCKGFSGENREYLFELANALRTLSPESEDLHVWDLERRVKALEEKEHLRLDSQNLKRVDSGYKSDWDSSFEDEEHEKK